jgi:hypothetical protein
MVVAFLIMTDNSSDSRNNIRTPFRAGVKITHPDLGELFLKTRDMSNSGVFLNFEENSRIKIGDIVTIQSTDIEDAPVIEAEIVRIEKGGFAVYYLVD